MNSNHPQLITARLDKLRPTQITVGKREVALKRKHWNSLNKKGRTAALESHCFPAIAGPDGKFYIVDHHHFGLALIEEDVKTVSLSLLKDLSFLDLATFWRAMDFHQWVHPFDSDGVRLGFDAIPTQLSRLNDDPYRSLAGEVRRAGGYAKDAAPFCEFMWADFFRPQFSRDLLDTEFDTALKQAVQLAGAQQARYLPGWTGVIELV